MTKQKIYIDERVEGLTFQKLYDRVGTIIFENPDLTWDKIEIGSSSEYECPYATLEYTRDETDEEEKRRIDWEERAKNSRLRQYEALKKEFGE